MIAGLMMVLQGAPVATRTGTFQSRRITESSGVAVSRAHPGVLWTHNDSGDGPYLYATDLSGGDLGAVLVPGAEAVDWEDIALAACPDQPGDCLYIADTGDNLERRSSVSLYVVPEPDPPTGPADTLGTTAAPLVIHLVYPDGRHDVEAVYVGVRDTAVYLVSKGRHGPIRLYRVPRQVWKSAGSSKADRIMAELVQDLPIDPAPVLGRWVTAAAERSDGRVVAIRTYTEIYFFTPGEGGRLKPASSSPCPLFGLEPQGEGVDFLDDSTLVLTSESASAGPAPIHTIRCTS